MRDQSNGGPSRRLPLSCPFESRVNCFRNGNGKPVADAAEQVRPKPVSRSNTWLNGMVCARCGFGNNPREFVLKSGKFLPELGARGTNPAIFPSKSGLLGAFVAVLIAMPDWGACLLAMGRPLNCDASEDAKRSVSCDPLQDLAPH